MDGEQRHVDGFVLPAAGEREADGLAGSLGHAGQLVVEPVGAELPLGPRLQALRLVGTVAREGGLGDGVKGGSVRVPELAEAAFIRGLAGAYFAFHPPEAAHWRPAVGGQQRAAGGATITDRLA
jgi:hypothetical protein